MKHSSARLVAALLSVAALATLGGCGILFSEPVPPCPRVAILDQAQSTTIYRDGPGRDLTDVAYEVALLDVIGVCDYDIDDDESTVTLEYSLMFQATRGPAASDDTVEVPYFVALAGPDKQILAKEVFTVGLRFPEFAVRVVTTEQIYQEIPLRSGRDASLHDTFVGFQLTRAQLEDMRRMGAY